MIFKVRNIEPIRQSVEDDEQITEYALHFDTHDNAYHTVLHGSVRITPEEYASANGSILAISSSVGTKLQQRLSEGMNLKVRNVELIRQTIDDIEQIVEYALHFDTLDNPHYTVLHGSIRVTPSEYDQTGGNFGALATTASVKLEQRIAE